LHPPARTPRLPIDSKLIRCSPINTHPRVIPVSLQQMWNEGKKIAHTRRATMAIRNLRTKVLITSPQK